MKKIAAKNYYVVLFVSILVIVLTLYVRSFYLSYEENRKNSSIFSDKSVSQVNVDDFKFAFEEANEVLLYVSYIGNSQIYNVDKKIYREFEKRELLDKVIYFNVSDFSTSEYIKLLRDKFPIISSEIGISPQIIYIKNGVAQGAINSNDGLLSSDDVINMLTKYGIE